MNTKHISLAFAVATALLAGCAKSPVEEVKTSEQFTNLELAYVGATETKAAIDGTAFPTDGEIGLYLFKDEAAATPYGESGYTNVKYTYNSTKEKWTAAPSIKVGSTPGYLFGYYPYDSEVANIKAIPVTSSLNGDDVMYATPVKDVTDQTAAQTAITMNHALARVSITVKNNGYAGAAKLSKIKFSGAEIAPEGTLNALDGSVTATKSEVTLDVTGDAQTVTTAGTIYECLLVPSKAVDGKQTVTLTLTIDGEDKTATLSGNNGVIIAKGTKSNITITLSNSGISVQTVSVEEWNVVEVGGHKVTVKVADDIAAGDIMFSPYVDGNNVIIKATSFQDKLLVCSVGDNAQCVRTRTNNKFTFTISEIQSDIEAVLAYAPPVTLTVIFDGNGKVWIGDDKNRTSGQYQSGYQVEIHAEPDDNFRLFRWNDNNRETTRTITVGDTDVAYRASFISANMIPGLFTVNSSNKQVFLSKGNLYYDGNENRYCFEANQYDIPPLTPVDDNIKNETENHVGHFYWSKNETVARSLSHYSDSEASVSDVFFTNDSSDPTKPNSSFTVSGQKGVWRVLSGKNDGEWKYLLDSRKTAYGSGVLSAGNRHYAMVKVNNMAGLLIFPDDFSSWPSGAGSEPTVFDTYSSNTNNRNYTVAEFTVLQNNGCVFLPEAGNRDGDPNYSYPASVLNVGSYGYYWSSTPYDSNISYVTIFRSDLVDSSNHDYWRRAHAVRLVTDAK